jgi:hypothetical protein
MPGNSGMFVVAARAPPNIRKTRAMNRAEQLCGTCPPLPPVIPSAMYSGADTRAGVTMRGTGDRQRANNRAHFRTRRNEIDGAALCCAKTDCLPGSGACFAHGGKAAQGTDPSLRFGISPADYHPSPRKACGLGAPMLTPARRLNLTKLFAFFLPKAPVFLRSLSATIS